ncbi:hypothetical protein GCM10023322_78110 [Rugosimonospora acidiphila]|uniref:Uncharacterized protein n=1 Tax=Rugosimonospora acidiphila TaxID=556531 RepID=A0ABP9SSN5_9ACTN
MSSYLSVGNGGPDAAIDAALRVKSEGDDLAEVVRALRDAIERIEQQRPWGDGDECARAFESNYLKPTAGSGTPANEAVKQCLVDSGPSLSRIGSTVVQAMLKFSITDVDGGNLIKQTMSA